MISTEAAPNGSAWAVIFAAAIGCASFGLLADLSEVSKSVSKCLNLYNPSGDLSGKSTIAVAVWLVAWAILHASWKQRNFRRTAILSALTIILILAALIATFPPTFELISRM